MVVFNPKYFGEKIGQKNVSGKIFCGNFGPKLKILGENLKTNYNVAKIFKGNKAENVFVVKNECFYFYCTGALIVNNFFFFRFYQ